VVLPVYANDAFGSATDLGLLISGFAAGGLAGAVAFGAVGHRLPRRALWGGRFLLATAPYWVLALGPSLPVAMAALAVCGVAIGGTNPLLSTVRFERTPAELRGRVFGALRVIGGAAAPLGRLLAGLGIAAFGLGPVVLALAVGPLVLAAGVLLTPAFRLMDAPAPPESASPVADSSRKTTAT
jgi:MFS family permease